MIFQGKTLDRVRWCREIWIYASFQMLQIQPVEGRNIQNCRTMDKFQKVLKAYQELSNRHRNFSVTSMRPRPHKNGISTCMTVCVWHNLIRISINYFHSPSLHTFSQIVKATTFSSVSFYNLTRDLHIGMCQQLLVQIWAQNLTKRIVSKIENKCTALLWVYRNLFRLQSNFDWNGKLKKKV